jgi:hypothetical protein
MRFLIRLRSTMVSSLSAKPCKSMLAWLAENPEQLDTVEWRDLERIMRETFEGLGFDTFLTRSTKDGSFDLQLGGRGRNPGRISRRSKALD